MDIDRLQYLADEQVFNAAYNYCSIKTAQESSTGSNLASGIANYLKNSIWDKEHPVASIVAFITPSLLWTAGFGWMTFIYEVAEVFGFDFKGLFTTVGQELKDFIQTLVSSEHKPSEIDIYGKVHQVVADAAQQHFESKPDMTKLPELAKSVPEAIMANMKSDMSNVDDILSFAAKYQGSNKSIFKEAGIFSLGAKLSRFFVKTIAFIITKLLVSLGLAAAVGATKTVLGLPTSKEKETPSDQQAQLISISPQAAQLMKVYQAKSVSSDITEPHMNSAMGAWLETGDINNIQETLSDWVFKAYPGLNKYRGNIEESPAMQSMASLFRDKNSMATGLGMFSVPKPFNTKLQVVNQIVGKFLADNPGLDQA